MFGPEGHPQHCCAWLGVASSFPSCASSTSPEEVGTPVCMTFLFLNLLDLFDVYMFC